MQVTEKILSIINDRGKRNLELERVYRLLYNKDLYLTAYGNLYANNSAATEGINDDIVEGMSIDKIEKLIESIKKERYRWNLVRRIDIEKKDGKNWSLRLSTWTDKLLQEVIKLILKSYYEPQFSSRSHGFRQKKGVHTCLNEIRCNWKSVKWFIEGDISDCFRSIDHDILLEILSKKIKDNRFIRLIKHFLESGYIEDWKYNKTYSGCPQGGILSPLLSNIYMNEFDKYMEEKIEQYNKGNRRTENKKYKALYKQIIKYARHKDYKKCKELRKELQSIPSKNPFDEKFRRLYYVRYADDWLIGVSGSLSECKDFKENITNFLKKELRLTLSEEKTLITHAKNEKVKFLGYELLVLENNRKKDYRGQRIINDSIVFKVPREVISNRIKKYTKNGKPIHRTELKTYSDYDIIMQYQSEIRGLVQFYTSAYNVHELHKVKRIMELSLGRTLAGKYKTTLNKILKKYKKEILVNKIPYKVLEAVVERREKKPLTATFGGFPIAWQKKAVIKDEIKYNLNY